MQKPKQPTTHAAKDITKQPTTYAAKDITKQPTMHTSMPFYSQKKEPWASCPYHKYKIFTDGCAPVAFAMCASYLLEREITPADVAQWVGQRFAGFRGRGTKPKFFPAAAAHYGLTCSGTKKTALAVEALKAGKPVIYYTGGSKGIFSKITHYLVLSGIDEDGKILIHNPNGMNDGKSFPIETVDRYKMRRISKDSYFIVDKP